MNKIIKIKFVKDWGRWRKDNTILAIEWNHNYRHGPWIIPADVAVRLIYT